MSDRVLKLRESFASRIVGQSDATVALTRVLENHLGGFADPRRPLGALLFLGPTGTGKTSAVEAMCEGLFGFRDAMLKIDCGEFQHSHEVAKLIGSPPGYLGHRETPPRLNQKALDQYQTPELPISVLLFDEIEKACDELWHFLLNILDKGMMTAGNGDVTNFTKTIIVMTSNVGAKDMSIATGDEQFGFQTEQRQETDDRKLKEIALAAARRKFTPEFLNRMDEIVMFNTLSKAQIEEILGLEVGYLQAKLFAKQAARLILSPNAKTEILERGYDRKYNARNIRRTIERDIMQPIARAISTLQIKHGEDIQIDFALGEFVFYAQTPQEINWPSQAA